METKNKEKKEIKFIRYGLHCNQPLNPQELEGIPRNPLSKKGMKLTK